MLFVLNRIEKRLVMAFRIQDVEKGGEEIF